MSEKVHRRRLAITILGSTGSVGQSALRVIREHSDRLRVIGLAARGGHPEVLLEQVREFHPECLAVSDPSAGEALRDLLPPEVELLVGPEAASKLASRPADRVVAAIVGAAGLEPVHSALAAGIDVALANKEALVLAGGVLMGLAARTGAAVLPVDSEHAALHQALRGGRGSEVRRLTLTASGGPLRERREPLATVTPEEAVRHPTWEMGAKISVDSATLMNKGLELIEATHLFEVEESRIGVVVHPQSIIHSLVEFCDGSFLAQLSANDMVFPLQYALAYPERWANSFPRLDLSSLGRLDLLPVDSARFPSVELARRALRLGDRGPAVLNAGNEVAVEAFLAGEIRLPTIFELVTRLLDELEQESGSGRSLTTLSAALDLDASARRRSRELLSAGLGSSSRESRLPT